MLSLELNIHPMQIPGQRARKRQPIYSKGRPKQVNVVGITISVARGAKLGWWSAGLERLTSVR